jgi:hypothetical protein
MGKLARAGLSAVHQHVARAGSGPAKQAEPPYSVPLRAPRIRLYSTPLF